MSVVAGGLTLRQDFIRRLLRMTTQHDDWRREYLIATLNAKERAMAKPKKGKPMKPKLYGGSA